MYMYLSYGICKNLRNKAGLYLLCHAIVCLIPYLHSFSHVSAEFLWVQLSANSSLEWIWQAELPQSSGEGEFPQSAAFHSWKTKFLCCVHVPSCKLPCQRRVWLCIHPVNSTVPLWAKCCTSSNPRSTVICYPWSQLALILCNNHLSDAFMTWKCSNLGAVWNALQFFNTEPILKVIFLKAYLT